MGRYFVELNALSAPSTTATIYFALGVGIAFDSHYVPAGLVSWQGTTQKIELDTTGLVSTTDDNGTIVIANMADALAGAGPLDAYLRGYGFQGQPARLWYAPDFVWANKVQVDMGILDQPVATGALQGNIQDSVAFPLRDFRAVLDVPFATQFFLGDGSALEGTPQDLGGKPKPIVYGNCFNIDPPLTNANLLLYQIACNAGVKLIGVDDGAVNITGPTGGYFTNMASFQAASVSAGHYIAYEGTGGTYIRLGSQITHSLNVQAYEDFTIEPTPSYRSHAQVWSRIGAVLGRSLDTASVTAADTLDNMETGFYWGIDSTDTQRQVLDKILQSFSGYEVYEWTTGLWKIGKLVVPDHSNAVTLRVLTPTSRFAAADRKLVSAAIARPPWTTNGVPPNQITIKYGPNLNVLTASQLAGSVTSDVVSYYMTDWLTCTVKSSTPGIWAYPGQVVIESGYVWWAPASFISHIDLTAECTRLLALMQIYYGYFQIVWIPKVYPTPDIPLVGDVAKMVLPRYGNPSAQYYKMFQTSLKVDANGPLMSAIVGLETA